MPQISISDQEGRGWGNEAIPAAQRQGSLSHSQALSRRVVPRLLLFGPEPHLAFPSKAREAGLSPMGRWGLKRQCYSLAFWGGSRGAKDLSRGMKTRTQDISRSKGGRVTERGPAGSFARREVHTRPPCKIAQDALGWPLPWLRTAEERCFGASAVV